MALEETRQRGLVSAPTDDAQVESGTQPAPPGLEHVVENAWFASWSFPEGASHTVEMLSAPSVHLVLEPGNSRIVGVHTHLWSRTLSGAGEVRALKLRPGAVPAFFDVPADALTNREVPWSELLGPEPTMPLGEFAKTILRPGSCEAIGWVAHAKNHPQLTRVDDLARHAGTSVRTLQRLFKLQVGASPKWVLRRFRLQEAASRIEGGAAPDLAELALELGYSDQAHLSRDFKDVVGVSLRTFERRVR